MQGEAEGELRRDGFATDAVRIERALDLRYAGQGYELTIPCTPGALTAGGLKTLRAAFDHRHHTMFGHSAPQEPVEVVSYRVRGIGRVPPVQLPRFARAGTTLADARRALRPVRFDGATIDCPVYQRERLDVGLTIEGPAVLDQFDCTTVLCSGQSARVDEWKNLIVTMEK
jgi:N-methylhydantoinase A